MGDPTPSGNRWKNWPAIVLQTESLPWPPRSGGGPTNHNRPGWLEGRQKKGEEKKEADVGRDARSDLFPEGSEIGVLFGGIRPSPVELNGGLHIGTRLLQVLELA